MSFLSKARQMRIPKILASSATSADTNSLRRTIKRQTVNYFDRAPSVASA